MPRHKTPSLNSSLPKQGGQGWVSPFPSGGVGRGRCPLTLHRNPLSSNKLHRTVKFFYLLQLFNNTIQDTTSIYPEMYHHSLLGTFIA